MTEQVNHAKCGRCKCWRVTPAMFLNEKGRLMKTCGECRRNKHKCDQCDKDFSRKGDLNTHVKAVHDKIKDVECPECESKFSRKGDLKQHIKAVHDKIKDVECDKCEYKCSKKSVLNQHQKYYCNGGIASNKSTGELKVQAVLEKYEIDYVFDGSHNNLRSFENKGVLRFDFCIPTEDNSFVFIEFDGRQHERPTQFGSQTSEEGLEQFNRQQQNDRIKNEYCKDKNYPLLRIRYNNTKIEETILQFFEDNDVEYILGGKFVLNF